MKAIFLAAAVAAAIAIFGTPLLIGWLRGRGIGQHIREEGPQGHQAKAGTPIMGGIVIIAGTILGYAVAHLRRQTLFTRSGLLVLALVVLTAVVGLVDDWVGITRGRNLGLNKRGKFLSQLVVAIAFALLAVYWADTTTTISLTRMGGPFSFDVPNWVWIAWATLVVVGASNAVNLTDGLDGLAAGASVFTFSTFVVIGFWQFRHGATYQVPHGLDLAIVAAAVMGGCVGFLWWNAAPARIFMGDTGSLALGSGIAGLALLTHTDLLLPLLGGLFVVETLSVIIQVFSFRVFHRRVFKMAPIHHHFELAGWPETTVIIRLWLMAGAVTALGLAFYYGDFLRQGIPS